MTMLLSTQLRPPTYSPAVIDRQRLYDRLDGWDSHRSTVIYAPAGYGKSTLVSRYIEHAGIEEQAAWLSLTEDENDASNFVRYVAAALDTLMPGALAFVEPILQGRSTTPQQAMQRLMIWVDQEPNHLSDETNQHLLFVLDDLQRVQSAEVADLIDRMLEYGPANLHLLILSRRRTGPSLARLFAQGRVLALDKDDLRFTEGEVRAYLERHGYHDATPSDVSRLTERTEGWASALHLAILSAPQPGSVPDLLEILRGVEPWTTDYLTSEVLSRLSPKLRRFLLQTSILDQFNAELCGAVVDEGHAYARLMEVVQLDLFAIDLGSGWYRYHHLFQALLQHHLRLELDEDAVAELHHRAADWLAAQGQDRAAVRHLLAAGAEQQAADLLEQRVPQKMLKEPRQTLLLLERLPTHVLEQRPRLLLDRCMNLLLLDDTQFVACVARTAEILREQQTALEDDPALLGQFLLLDATAAWRNGNLERANSLVREAVTYEPALDAFTAATLQFLQAILHRAANQHQKAFSALEHSLQSYRDSEFYVGVVSVEREMARWSMELGNGDMATARFKHLLAISTSNRPEIVMEHALASLFAAENSYWQNDRKQAVNYVDAGLSQAHALGDDELVYLGTAMRKVHAGEGADEGPTFATYMAYHEHFSRWTFPEVVLDLDVRRLISADRCYDAWALVEGHRPTTANPLHTFRFDITYLRAAIAYDPDLPEIAKRMQTATAYHNDRGLRLFLLHLLALEGWRQLKLGGPEAAVPILKQAVDLANETGYVRVILDIPDLMDLATGLEFNRSDALPPPEAGVIGSDLTERERQVLRLLAADMTYEQIGREMMISVNTVRTHIRNLYAKLSASRRGQAIDIAQRNGLLA